MYQARCSDLCTHYLPLCGEFFHNPYFIDGEIEAQSGEVSDQGLTAIQQQSRFVLSTRGCESGKGVLGTSLLCAPKLLPLTPFDSLRSANHKQLLFPINSSRCFFFFFFLFKPQRTGKPHIMKADRLLKARPSFQRSELYEPCLIELILNCSLNPVKGGKS